MRLEMCAVDHEAFRNAGLRRQDYEDLFEYAAFAPADESVVEGFV